MEEKLLPIWMEDQYLKTEQYILGAIFADEKCVSTVREKITPDMFRNPTNRGLYQAVCELQDENIGIDIATVGMRYKQNGGVWDGDYLSQLVDAACTASDVNVYCDILVKENVRRSIYSSLHSWMLEIESGVDPFGVATVVSQKMDDWCDFSDVVQDGVTYEKAVQNMIEKASASQEGERKPAVRCGYRTLDRILGGGFQRNGLYILAARPGKGKTAMAVNLARRIAVNGNKVLFISLEMDNEQLVSRMTSADIGGISSTSVLNGMFDPGIWDKITDFAIRTRELPIVFNKKFSMNVNDIRLLAKRKKPDFIIVDYLGLIANENESGKLYEETTKKSRKIKELALDMGCPILCLAQLNRESEKRGNGKPMLSDLRDSGSIEQDADAVIFNWVENDTDDASVLEEQSSEPVELKLIIAKNRHGGLGIVSMYWDKVSGNITELERIQEPALSDRESSGFEVPF